MKKFMLLLIPLFIVITMISSAQQGEGRFDFEKFKAFFRKDYELIEEFDSFDEVDFRCDPTVPFGVPLVVRLRSLIPDAAFRS